MCSSRSGLPEGPEAASQSPSGRALVGTRFVVDYCEHAFSQPTTFTSEGRDSLDRDIGEGELTLDRHGRGILEARIEIRSLHHEPLRQRCPIYGPRLQHFREQPSAILASAGGLVF
jgi:hypothetical protein